MEPLSLILLGAIPVVVAISLRLLGIRYIPHGRVGIVEKLWSGRGNMKDGGSIGYIYARDGEPLPPTQTLGRTVPCNSFQDARAFLEHGGQRGRQRAILREGVYALNLALFVVITEDQVYCGAVPEKERERYEGWRKELRSDQGFRPIVLGAAPKGRALVESAEDLGRPRGAGDNIGVITVHDGAPIESGEVIAPEVHPTDGLDHDYFQDVEAFLSMGGRRGKQLQVLTDGTFFLNRWFATVEVLPKTLIPIGYVGVVVSYHGRRGEDLTVPASATGSSWTRVCAVCGSAPCPRASTP